MAVSSVVCWPRGTAISRGRVGHTCLEMIRFGAKRPASTGLALQSSS